MRDPLVPTETGESPSVRGGLRVKADHGSNRLSQLLSLCLSLSPFLSLSLSPSAPRKRQMRNLHFGPAHLSPLGLFLSGRTHTLCIPCTLCFPRPQAPCPGGAPLCQVFPCLPHPCPAPAAQLPEATSSPLWRVSEAARPAGCLSSNHSSLHRSHPCFSEENETRETGMPHAAGCKQPHLPSHPPALQIPVGRVPSPYRHPAPLQKRSPDVGRKARAK